MHNVKDTVFSAGRPTLQK